ncbi:phytoene desaturase family protein [Paenibacillus sp. D51F]
MKGGRKAVVVGAGLGGLSCAIHLALQGWGVTVVEKEPLPGGKLQRVEEAGYRFDNGPSTMTMQPVFDAVFEAAGRRREDYVEFYPLDPVARNAFHDGTIVDVTGDIGLMEEQIARYSPEDALKYRPFMRESARLYELASKEFLSRLVLDWRDKLQPSLLAGFGRIRPFTPMSRTIRNYFRHPHTLAMFGRYATYVGASPQRAPSIFNMMAHVEADQGVFGVKGGTYSIVAAFAKLAGELGVAIAAGDAAKEILIAGGKAAGVETEGGNLWEADAVVVNADALAAVPRLIPDHPGASRMSGRLHKLEPSVSGFVLLAGVERDYPQLLHHNVFFPERYHLEFDDLFRKGILPEKPAVYVCRSGGGAGVGGGEGEGARSSLFVLVNAPAQRDGYSVENRKEEYAARILGLLEERGLLGIGAAVRREGGLLRIQTPDDLQRRTGAWRGSIYGMSSNGFRQSFFRYPSKDSRLGRLWYVGGSTHPGGGTPIVTIGGRLVAERIAKEGVRAGRA